MKYFGKILFATCLTGLVSCNAQTPSPATNNGATADKKNSAAGPAAVADSTDLAGIWLGPCFGGIPAESPVAAYAKTVSTQLVFIDEFSYLSFVLFHPDEECNEEPVRVDFDEYAFQLAPYQKGSTVTKMNFTYKRSFSTPQTEAAKEGMATGTSFGISTWEVGQDNEVTGRAEDGQPSGLVVGNSSQTLFERKTETTDGEEFILLNFGTESNGKVEYDETLSFVFGGSLDDVPEEGNAATEGP